MFFAHKTNNFIAGILIIEFSKCKGFGNFHSKALQLFLKTLTDLAYK